MALTLNHHANQGTVDAQVAKFRCTMFCAYECGPSCFNRFTVCANISNDDEEEELGMHEKD